MQTNRDNLPSVQQLKNDFMAQGYKEQSAQIHAECKHQANVYFDVSIQNKRRFVSPAKHNASKKVKTFINKGGKIHYLQEKGTRKVYVSVAIPASTQAGIRPAHKLWPEEAFGFDAVKMFGKY